MPEDGRQAAAAPWPENKGSTKGVVISSELLSQSFIPHTSGDGRSGAGPHLSPQQIEAILIPLPSRREQRAIVARLDAMRVQPDELQRLPREVEAELASCTPALLAKALRGEL